MQAVRSLAMKKKIALLITFAVCVIGLAAWFIVYNAQRGSAVEGARDTLGRYLTRVVGGARRPGRARPRRERMAGNVPRRTHDGDSL